MIATDDTTGAPKPRLRGVLHQWAAVCALGAGIPLVALTPCADARIAAAIYAASLVLLLTISAVYHRFQWTPHVRIWLRRADHASIFLLIGGSYTPIAMVALGGDTGRHLLVAIWCGVALGVLVSMLWPGAPKWVTAAIAVAVGWTLVPYFGAVGRALSSAEIWLIALGGAAYTLGALVYATKRPDPWPRNFGYHELFHALTLVGAGLHYAAMAMILFAAKCA
jgi:hemolysin III